MRVQWIDWLAALFLSCLYIGGAGLLSIYSVRLFNRGYRKKYRQEAFINLALGLLLILLAIELSKAMALT